MAVIAMTIRPTMQSMSPPPTVLAAMLTNMTAVAMMAR